MKRTIILPALALALLLSACGVKGQTERGKTEASAQPSPASEKAEVLTAEEAYERISGGDSVIILDVRTAEEYAEGHIPGAILLPNEEIGSEPPAALPVMDAEILVYCRSGNRSAQAGEKLVKMGYTNVKDFGGINSWPYETESGEFEASVKDGTLSSFMAYDLGGKPVDESVFEGYGLTMINIWATFCGPCLAEMPELGLLAEEYRDKGVQIIGIAADVRKGADGVFSEDMVETARSLAEETGAGYIHLLPSSDLVSAKLKDVNAVPETIFVDSRGKQVGESYIGARSGEEWAEIIDSLLEAGK